MSAPKPFGSPAAAKAEDESFDVEVPSKDDQMKVPVGECTVVLVNIEKSKSKAGNPMWVWTVVVADGRGAGEELKIYTAMTPAAMWKLTETMVAFGLAEPSDEAVKVKFAKSDAMGRRAIAVIEADEYNDSPRASVAKLKAHPDGYKVPTGGTGTKPSVPAS